MVFLSSSGLTFRNGFANFTENIYDYDRCKIIKLYFIREARR